MHPGHPGAGTNPTSLGAAGRAQQPVHIRPGHHQQDVVLHLHTLVRINVIYMLVFSQRYGRSLTIRLQACLYISIYTVHSCKQ